MKFTKYAVYLTAFLLMASASPLVQKSAVIRPITAAAEEAQKAAPHAAGVMIARAAVQKPWIFAELKNLPFEDESLLDAEQLALDFIDDVEKCQPQEFWKTRLQRFFAYYCLNFSFAHYFQTQMLNSKDNDDARARLKEYFEKCPDDKNLI